MSTKQKLFGFYLGLPARQRIHHLMEIIIAVIIMKKDIGNISKV